LADIDVWGINYYDGLSFSDLFDRWEALSTAPMFLGEYGADAYDALNGRSDEGAQAHATALLTQEIMDHSSVVGGVCLGGLIFELADEWWKDGHGSPHEQDIGGIAPGGGPHPDKVFNEEWWGLLDLHRRPRPAYHIYSSIQPPRARAPVAVMAAGAVRRSCTSGGCVELPPPCKSKADCAAAVAGDSRTGVAPAAARGAGRRLATGPVQRPPLLV